ncbi:SCO6745 family protein [Amycolatopsis sp. NPDC004368]
MGEAAEAAKKFKGTFDTLHSLIYFVPEADEHLAATGLRPGRMTYFASRSAPMGAVGPGVVAATFYNFNPALVEKYIPRAWTLATPEQVTEGRFKAVDAALTRLLGDEIHAETTAEAAELAREAVAGCESEGRALYAGHASLDWPEKPHLVLWHALTLLREHRGDAHVAALMLHGLHGLAALVTHVASGAGFTPEMAKSTRGWSDEQWDAEVARLADQGVIGPDGDLTDKGTKLRERVEAATNAASEGPWRHLGGEKSARLAELCRPLSRAVVKAGAFPRTLTR